MLVTGVVLIALAIGVIFYRHNLGDDALRAEDEKEEQQQLGGL